MPKIQERSHPFRKYIGVLKTFPGGIQEINAWVDDLRQEDTNDLSNIEAPSPNTTEPRL